MQNESKRWAKLFLFTLGITLATTFILQWLASDFWWQHEKFSILGLELFYSRDKVLTILSEIKDSSRQALYYQLIFDFAFMAGIYPLIASFCMLVRERTAGAGARNILFALATLQPVAWIFDMIENRYLLSWLQKPVIGDEFTMYHNIVGAKWIIALAGALIAVVLYLVSKTRRKKLKLKN